MNPESLKDLFTVESLLSLQGAVAAALLIPCVLGSLIDNDKYTERWRKWTSFVIAILLAYLVALLAPEQNFVKWIIAFFNGFLVFASAMGINQAASPQKPMPAPVQLLSRERVAAPAQLLGRERAGASVQILADVGEGASDQRLVEVPEGVSDQLLIEVPTVASQRRFFSTWL